MSEQPRSAGRQRLEHGGRRVRPARAGNRAPAAGNGGTAAALGTEVPGVQRAVILDPDVDRLELIFEGGADGFGSWVGLLHQASVRLLRSNGEPLRVPLPSL